MIRIPDSQNYLFKVREGATTLSPDEREGLKLNHIHSMQELDEAEALNIFEGLEFLRLYHGDNYLDLAFAKRLHKMLYQHVWKWAGVYRTTEKNVGVDPYKIQIELKKLFEDTKAWIQYRSYPPEEMGARFHHRLVWIHPFPNGNGRWARIFTEYLYKRQNWGKPNWHFGEEPHDRRHRYIEALREADQKHFLPLIKFMQFH
jgi:Fic-DOC domain mobile mystery protein B